MKNRFKLFVGATAIALSIGALAKPALHTATIDQYDNDVAQSSPLSKFVSDASQQENFSTNASQQDNFSTHEVVFREGQFKTPTAFCSFSSIDISDHERLLYRHAKSVGAATPEKANALGPGLGKRGVSGDSSMGFQLTCGD